MSLFRQLWLAVITSTVIAFAGSFLVSMLTARHYLEHQLAIKNNDNAASLALSMSQMAKDPVTLELQIAAIADSGQYASVRLIDPEGKTMIEKASPADASAVPNWFVQLFPIVSPPGQAQVNAGWNQFATIELSSHSHFAYQELWRGGIELLLWFLIGGSLVGMFGMRMLHRIKRPLDTVVEQAQAISERRLNTIPEPQTPELRSVVRALNSMVERLKAIFADEATRLERLRREATLDSLTGLPNRSFFLNQLESTLNTDDAATTGSLLILRIADLSGINKRLGRETADELLRRMGLCFSELIIKETDAIASRLNGADFALLLPGIEDPSEQAKQLLTQLEGMHAAGLIDGERIGHIASSVYFHYQEVSDLLSQVDAALASAENQSGLGWSKADTEKKQYAITNSDWKKMLNDAINNQRLRLAEFPVVDNDGQLIHLECPLRLKTGEDGEWLNAGSFMPMASRLTLTAELDLAAVSLALNKIAGGASAVAINISSSSILNSRFLPGLKNMLTEHQDLSSQLWLEVSESGIFEHLDAFQVFCKTARSFSCHLGIEHFGRKFSEIGKLQGIGLNYLKVDSGFIRSIHTQQGNQELLKGLCNIARNIGLQIIAEGINTPEELAEISHLGFDGATGPELSRRVSP